MTEHYNYKIGWRVPRPLALAHYYITSNTTNLAMTHCGVMAHKDKLTENPAADRCGYCQAVEDMRGEDNEVLTFIRE